MSAGIVWPAGYAATAAGFLDEAAADSDGQDVALGQAGAAGGPRAGRATARNERTPPQPSRRPVSVDPRLDMSRPNVARVCDVLLGIRRSAASASMW